MRIFQLLEGIVTLAYSKDNQQIWYFYLQSRVVIIVRNPQIHKSHKADLLGKGWLVLSAWTVIRNYSNKAAG